MLLVIGGIKGGTGKTTLATNLAVMAARQGKNVLLVDADEQRSCSDWAEQRVVTLGVAEQTMRLTTLSLMGSTIHMQLKRLQSHYDHIIVDTGGRDTQSQRSALVIANKFLLPFKPRSIDIWTLMPVSRLIEQVRAVNEQLQCHAIINQADASGKDNDQVLDLLSQQTAFQVLRGTIGNRKEFANAASQGLGVTETKKDKKAYNEIQNLYQFIFGE